MFSEVALHFVKNLPFFVLLAKTKLQFFYTKTAKCCMGFSGFELQELEIERSDLDT